MSSTSPPRARARILGPPVLLFLLGGATYAQMTDQTQTPNTLGVGIKKSLSEQIGAGRGDLVTPGSSLFMIGRDPFRAVQRGRQLFQRKFTAYQGVGPRKNDGVGDIALDGAVGAGLTDSCASCHGRPFGSAGVGGNVFTRPDSRDAPHLFGLGLQEMLADEMTAALRSIRSQAITQATQAGQSVSLPLIAKGVSFGLMTAHANGSVDTSGVVGVDADLRVRPFFAEGKTISIREFAIGAFKAEMGLESVDPDTLAASQGADVVTPSGMGLTGTLDAIEAPPVQSELQDGDLDGHTNEIPTSLVDFMEFYLLNYFKPGIGKQTAQTTEGRQLLSSVGCTVCHVPDLMIDRDRRVADVATAYNSVQSNRVFNQLFATATGKFVASSDGTPFPTIKTPQFGSFLVENIFADFKRHDLGPAFHERNFDGTVRTHFMTEPLWGVGSTAPYGHDGRSSTLEEVILRHGGEAQASRDAFALLTDAQKSAMFAFLNSLVLFSPPDTASNLEPANPLDPAFPLQGHGAINLSVLFNRPRDKE
ncbi:MAG: thiol oxidoreductase-like protein [Planctomycetes bacterium]|nr:thiol oxidoreductase-like protein [Planctomycetota bacterium]